MDLPCTSSHAPLATPSIRRWPLLILTRAPTPGQRCRERGGLGSRRCFRGNTPKEGSAQRRMAFNTVRGMAIDGLCREAGYT